MKWFSRDHDENIELRTKVAQLTQQLTVAQTNFDWLAAHVNRLEAERSQLLSRVLAISFPAPEIVRDTPPPTPTQSRFAGVPVEDEYANSIPAVQAMQNAFDDIGDEAASTLGIIHDRQGHVVHTR